ncbi:GntR family transcriptional regulator [Paraburkholderia pallida]|uniref:GntR family transcriptional regulator n=1 Tax=Paraburkholderia pallida TaxID=2547399 RepID=A0A4P7CUX3_9BURK|nr:GntR family transcriptional regulator [Paraburkholderia pallida]QBQ99928.1 GntR family transcriptional regulator [Paraburkholderia pallida]
MARHKTQNLPDFSALLTPKNSLMLAVERAVLRGQDCACASVPIAEQIAARLAGVITLDLVKSGQRLLEADISEVLHVSRAPVREALRILERDRLVEFQARRGAIVTAPDENELRDIFRVRSVLYVTMLEQATRENLPELEALLTAHIPRLAQAAEASIDAYAVESFLLNFATIGLCHNRLLVDILHSISLRTLRYVRLGMVAAPQTIRTSLEVWRAMQDAAMRRDGPLLLALATSRLDEARDAAVRAVVEQPS